MTAARLVADTACTRTDRRCAWLRGKYMVVRLRHAADCTPVKADTFSRLMRLLSAVTRKR
jgi:hypothetical protein